MTKKYYEDTNKTKLDIDGTAVNSDKLGGIVAGNYYHTGNLKNTIQSAPELATTNLNDLKGAASAGWYRQTSNASATSARGYPIAEAGSLRVEWTLNEFVIQTYTVYFSYKKFFRVYAEGAWQNWQEIYHTGNPPPSPDPVSLTPVYLWSGYTLISSSDTLFLSDSILNYEYIFIEAGESDWTSASALTRSSVVNDGSVACTFVISPEGAASVVQSADFGKQLKLIHSGVEGRYIKSVMGVGDK